MKKLLAMFLFAFALPVWGQNNPTKSVSPRRLGEVLNCLQTKLASIEGTPPRYAPGLYRVRYYYGVLTPGDDEANELQLVVYAPNENSGVLYRAYFDTKNGRQEIYIGDWGTLKKEHVRIIPDEVPSGVATYRHIEKLLDVLSHRPVITIMDSDVKPGPAACVYEP